MPFASAAPVRTEPAVFSTLSISPNWPDWKSKNACVISSPSVHNKVAVAGKRLLDQIA
jgi:hypothetical protein